MSDLLPVAELQSRCHLINQQQDLNFGKAVLASLFVLDLLAHITIAAIFHNHSQFFPIRVPKALFTLYDLVAFQPPEYQPIR